MVSVASILALLALAPLIAAQTRYTCSLQLARANRKVNASVEANLDSVFSCAENGRLLQGNGDMFSFTYTSECGESIVKCNCSPVEHPTVVAKVQRTIAVPQSFCSNTTMPPFNARCSLSVSQQQRKASLQCTNNKPAKFFCCLDDEEQVPCATGSMFPDLHPGNHCLTIKAQIEGSSEIVAVGKIPFQIRSTTSKPLNIQPRVLVDHEQMKATLLVEGTPVMCRCTLNGGAAVPCNNGTMFTGLTVGNHQLALNCCSVIPRLCETSRVSIEVKPTTQFTGKATVTNNTVVAEFNSSAVNVTYRCRLLKDGKVVIDWEPCTSPHKFCGVEPGRYTVQVECTSADLGTQIIEIGPITVTEPPLLVTKLEGDVSDDNLNVVFIFEASQPAEIFLCMLDEGQFQPCLPPYAVPLVNLTCGMHKLKVVAMLSSGVSSDPQEITFQKQCSNVTTTSGPRLCNVDVNLGVSKDGSVTLTYKSSNPNATLFCGVDAMKARLCLNNSVIASGLSPGTHVFHGRATCVVSPGQEDYLDLKNTTFTILPPDSCAGKQVTGVSVATSQHQNQVFLNIHFTGADGLTVMCSFNGAPLQPCTSPHVVNITHLCTGNYSLVLVGFCNGREVHKVASTITVMRDPDPCVTTAPTPTATTASITTPTPMPTPEPCRITDLTLKRSRNRKRLVVAFEKSSGCDKKVKCKCKVAGRKQKQCTNGITFKKAALIRSVTVNCLRKKVVVASLTGIV